MIQLKIDHRENYGIVILKIHGNIDQQTYIQLKDAIKVFIKPGKNRIVIDLSNTGHISSAGWDTIVNAKKAAGQNQGNVKICGLPAGIREVFDILDLRDLFRVYDTVGEAVDSFRENIA